MCYNTTTTSIIIWQKDVCLCLTLWQKEDRKKSHPRVFDIKPTSQEANRVGHGANLSQPKTQLLLVVTARCNSSLLPRNVALKASFLIWRLVQKLSEHTDKIILKVFTCCSQTIHCSRFKVFVLIDACYHWKPLTEPLQPLPQLPYPWPNCRALCVTTTSTTSAHPLLLGGDQGDRVTLQKSQPGRGQRHTVHTCPHISTPFHICPHTFGGTLLWHRRTAACGQKHLLV